MNKRKTAAAYKSSPPSSPSLSPTIRGAIRYARTHGSRHFVGFGDRQGHRLFKGDIVKILTPTEKGPLAGQNYARVLGGDSESERVKIGHIKQTNLHTYRVASIWKSNHREHGFGYGSNSTSNYTFNNNN